MKKTVNIFSCALASSINLLFPLDAKTLVSAEEKILENTPKALLKAKGICLANDRRPIIALLINQLLNNKSKPFRSKLLILDIKTQNPDFINLFSLKKE